MSEPTVAYVGGLPCRCLVPYEPAKERFIDAYDKHVNSCGEPWDKQFGSGTA